MVGVKITQGVLIFSYRINDIPDIKINYYVYAYAIFLKKKRNLQSKEKRPQHQNPLLTLSNLHFPPLSSILLSVECNYIYPPVNNLHDTYYTTTKARQYFENIK